MLKFFLTLFLSDTYNSKSTPSLYEMIPMYFHMNHDIVSILKNNKHTHTHSQTHVSYNN